MKLHEIKQLNEGHLYNDPAFTHFTDRKEILAFLRDNIMSKITARDVKIHSDGTTDILLPPSKHIKFVKGSFLALHKLPVKFGTVSCTFVITGLGLHTLENCPIEIVGNFVADNNKLVDLKFSPKVVAGNYSVRENRLTSLDGCTKSVGGEFDCSANDLKTIAGGPTFVDGDYEVSDNYLTMLDCKAVHVNGNVNVRGNPLKSIDGLEEAFTVC